MCGIAGMVARHGSGPPGRARLDAAVGALRHRGPDGSGVHVDGPCALGHTRLSIIDLAGGAQPLANEDGTIVVVFNGEIWNHLDLRRELEAAGHAFATRSDTEVLVHGYEQWGEGLLERLNGMFAFALWDGGAGRLLLARDRVGKKPLYLAETPDGVAFGSDIRTVLLCGGLRPEIDASLVPQYLFQRYVVAPDTLLRGVRKLRPGHVASYDGERLVERAWWAPPVAPVEQLAAGDLRALLRDAVEKRLMSDVPLGILLSGGIDSCAVLGLMREAGARDVASFTIGFSDPVFDERPYARIAAERAGTEHHEVVVDTGSFLDTLPRLAWARDEPMSEPSEIPLLLLAEFAGQHVKVALTGDGGDELFGGYPKYRADRLLRAGGPLAGAAIAAAGRLLALRRSHRRLGRAAEVARLRDPLVRWASWFRTFSPAEVAALVPRAARARAAEAALAAPLGGLLAPYAAVDPGRRMLLGDLFTYLPENMLLRGDKVLMAASLEGRAPLLDHRVVERACRTPAGQRVGLRVGKAILREAVRDLIPPEVLAQPKRGFPVPVARILLDDPSHVLRRLVLSERCLSRGLLDPDALRALVLDGGPATGERGLKLFTVAALELWSRVNVDEVRAAPPASLEELLDAGDAG